MKKRTLALLLSAVMVFGLAACGNNESSSTPANDDTTSVAEPSSEPEPNNEGGTPEGVLVIGVEANFDEKWNPLISDSYYDQQVLRQIFSSVMVVNSDNELEEEAGSISFVENDDGTLTYTVSLKEGMTFHDGEPVTIDDYIYGIYVRADPSFTGTLPLVTSDIVGIKEYYYDDADYSSKVAALEAEADAWLPENITADMFMEYATATDLDGYWDGDAEGWAADLEEYYGVTVDDPTDADEVFEALVNAEYDSVEDYDTYNWYLDNAKSELALGNLEDGVSVPEITGVVKVDDLTVEITYGSIDIWADRDLTTKDGMGQIMPAHYYGDFEKGNVAAIEANMEPMGSGPYMWGGFADNIATINAYDNFFIQTPKIATVRYQYIPSSDIVTSLVAGDIDIARPSANQAAIDELDAGGMLYDTTDNNGYGYLGLNHNNLTDGVRKGMLSLMNRYPSVLGYYGNDDLFSVIERPMSTVVAEYPQDAKEIYPYDVDAALGFFEDAGYTQNASGELVDASGNQLVVNAYVGGEGEGNHPAHSMLVQAANDLDSLGGVLVVNDVGFAVLTAAMMDGTADMFCLAWAEVNTCDKTSQFHSQGGQNRFNYNNPDMDALLDAISTTADFDERKALVAEMLELATVDGVEYPLYQRKNIVAYNPTFLNMDTVPEASTFYDYQTVLYTLEMNA